MNKLFSAACYGLLTLAASLFGDPLPLQITTASLPSGKAFAPYSAQLAATNGTGALIWSRPQIITDVVGWGYGEAADIPPGLTNDVIDIAAGVDHALALKANGTVVVWGANLFGQTNIPSGLTDVVAIAAGGYFSLALKSDGTVVAWGDNNLGQVNVPAGLSDIVGIAAGISHAMALKSNGTVIGWGDNEYGQATAPEGLSHVVAIAAGEHHSLALKSDGTVEGWGKEEISPPPEGLANVAAIVAGQNRSLALHTDGTVTQWPEQFDLEYLVPPPANLSQVVALATCPSPAFQYNLALKSNGSVVSWGNTESFYPGFLAPPESLTRSSSPLRRCFLPDLPCLYRFNRINISKKSSLLCPCKCKIDLFLLLT
jgi:alpha-tubulin suppressor-like RCC1 family protein